MRIFGLCLLAACSTDPILDASVFDGGSDAIDAARTDASFEDASGIEVGLDGAVGDGGVFDGGESDGGALIELCFAADPDVLSPIPVATESATCAFGLAIDAPEPLFGDLGTLPADYTRLHQICAMMNPAPTTLEHTSNSTIAAAVRAYLLDMSERPALQRALGSVSTTTTARIEALSRVWLDGNGFEHVLCGDLNPNGRVGGLHLWSEFYLAEREARANYLCTVEGIDDPDVVSIRYDWIPPGRSGFSFKPIGSLHVGMSPACLLAIGYYAIDQAIQPRPGAEPSFVVGVHGRPVSFALGVQNGAIVTVFPVADPR